MITFFMSHGQADVERGFSVNKNFINVNMKEPSIWRKCLLRDHIHNLETYIISTTEITSMLKVEKKSCCAACEGFRTYLHEEKKKKGAKKTKKKQVEQSKKILDKEIKKIEGKINHLMEN